MKHAVMMKVITALIAIAAATASCGSDDQPSASAQSAAPEFLTVSGTIEVPIDIQAVMKEKDHTIGVTGCQAKDGYDDVQAGTQVTVRDSGGSTVALGALEEGVLGGEAGDMLLTAPCAFAFEIDEVPAGSKFYSVEVAHRGEVSYDERDLDEPITLTLGD